MIASIQSLITRDYEYPKWPLKLTFKMASATWSFVALGWIEPASVEKRPTLESSTIKLQK